jgi:site-specific recombinase XerD
MPQRAPQAMEANWGARAGCALRGLLLAGMLTRLGQDAKMPFGIHPHMLRHSTGFKLANQGVDTRSLQHYLGTATYCPRTTG